MHPLDKLKQMKEEGRSYSQISIEIGIPEQTVRRWLDGKTTMSRSWELALKDILVDK